MTADDKSLVERAHAFCIEAHKGQTRKKSDRPYHIHPEAVVEILRTHDVREPAVLAAGYLHDVLEDTPVTREALAREFGEEVAGLVEELTNIGPPGRTFEQKHAALADEARRMSPRAKMIKLADRLHNLRDGAYLEPDKRPRMGRVTMQLLEALKPWPLAALAEEVRREAELYLVS